MHDRLHEGNRPVGIMADSHGEMAALRAALRLFRRRGCRRVFHLGDICDTLRPDTLDATVALLESAGVVAVRGNNEHGLLADLAGCPQPPVAARSRRYLERLPYAVRFGGALMVHSRPYNRRLGPACLREPLSEEDLARFCGPAAALAPQPRLMFRGHDHAPGLAYRDAAGRLRRQALLAGRRTALGGRLPCVVTCGALEEGFCLLWEPVDQRITCQRLPARSGRGPS